MKCRDCTADIPDGSNFCNICGAPQASAAQKHSRKKRGNGQGCVYKRGDKWAAEVTLGYILQDGKRKRKIRRKCGFDKKKDAVAYLETLRASAPARSGRSSRRHQEFPSPSAHGSYPPDGRHSAADGWQFHTDIHRRIPSPASGQRRPGQTEPGHSSPDDWQSHWEREPEWKALQWR